MAEQNTTNTTLEQLMNQNPLVKSGIKKVQKVQDQQIEEAVSAGVSTQDILKQLMQIASIEQPVAGTMKGPFSAIGDLLQGKGYHPFAPWTEPLGIDTAAKVMGLQQTAEKQPLEIKKSQTDIMKNLVDLAKATGNKDLYLGAGGKDIEGVDWRTGQPTEQVELAKKEAMTRAEVTARTETERNLRIGEFKKELTNYFQIGDMIPTAEGVNRFKQGVQLFGKSFFQSDIVGAAAKQLNNINTRMRVKVVKYNGDVGNISVVEQKAAEKILFSLSDSTKLRELKKAYLTDLGNATAENNGSAVRALIKQYVERPDFQVEYPELYKKYQDEQSLRSGETKESEKPPSEKQKTYKSLWE